MLIQKKSPNSYGQEQLVTYEFIYEFNDFYEFIYECMYEFKYFWIQKYMNSWNSWIQWHWIHMFSEFINYVLWIRCVIQSCYLLRVTLLLCQRDRAPSLCYPWLPSTGKPPSTVWKYHCGCAHSEWLLRLKAERAAGLMSCSFKLQSREIGWTTLTAHAHTGITHNHDRFWVNFRLIFNAFVVWGLALILRPDSNSELHGWWGPGCMIGQGGFNCIFFSNK